jgi:hypothetical protein
MFILFNKAVYRRLKKEFNIEINKNIIVSTKIIRTYIAPLGISRKRIENA